MIEYSIGISFVSRASWVEINSILNFFKPHHNSASEHWLKTQDH